MRHDWKPEPGTSVAWLSCGHRSGVICAYDGTDSYLHMGAHSSVRAAPARVQATARCSE